MKTSRLLIWTLALVLLTLPVFGALSDDLKYYYNFDDSNVSGATLYDASPNNVDATITGATTGQPGIVGESFFFDGSNDQVSFTPTGTLNNIDNDYTFSCWINIDSSTSNAYFLQLIPSSGATGSNSLYYNNALKILVYAGDGGASTAEAAVNESEWVHIVGVTNASSNKASIYRNGAFVETDSGTWGTDVNSSYTTSYIGRDTASRYIKANIDECGYWERALSPSEIEDLYNDGDGFAYPFTSCEGGPGATTDVDFTITDQWNSSSILSFNINVSWSNGTTTEHSTTNGTVSLINITSGSINVTYWNMTDYFDQTISDTLTENITNTVSTTTYQAVLCLNATSKVNEAWITADNFTIESTTRSSCFNITAGSHNVQANKAGWFSQNQTVTVTALSNATQTIYNMSYANLTIYAIDGTTNESLSGYDIQIGSIANPFFLETATGVTNHSLYLINDTYNTTITMPGYATTTGSANITVSGHTNYTFTLYRANSVTITIRDEITNDIITDNVTVRWTNNATTWENVTNTGNLFVSNLTVGNYTLLFYSSNYSTRTYTITVGNLSTQFLTAYMISSAYSTIFTVKDKDTGDVLDDVSFTMYKLVNSTWTTVESKSTDITGKAQVYYDPIGNYRFYLSLANYDDLVFYLNPILFSTYDVFMEKADPLNYSVDYDDISIIYSPHTFINGQNTSFNFLIASPDGLLTDYGLTLTYPGGSQSASGVNAIGEQLSVWANITNATRWDRVRLDYNYTTTIAGTRTFTQYLDIVTNATASENTWMANKDRTFGLGLFERFLIVTIIVIFTVGIASLVGQVVPGMALGLFLFGFMTYLGFIPIWGIIPSMIIGVIFLVWKSGGY